MKKSLAIGIAGLTIAGMGAAAAFPGIGMNKEINKMHDFAKMHRMPSEERIAAIENNDYEAFLESLPENSIFTPSKEEFEDIVLRHEAHEKVELAIENADYDSWLEAIEKLPFAKGMKEIVSKEDFGLLVQMHNAKKTGDYQKARGLREELGFENRGLRVRGMHNR